MRFSAWSSLAISACSAVALLLAPTASAHLSVSPSSVEAGALVDLTFGAPNEDDAAGIDRVTLAAPRGFELDDAEAKPGWAQARTGASVTWTGGSIPKGQFATFTIRGTAPADPGTMTFDVLVGDRAGKSSTYRVAVGITKGGPHDSGARTLGKAAVAIALAGVLIALGALFVGMYVWLRPPPAV